MAEIEQLLLDLQGMKDKLDPLLKELSDQLQKEEDAMCPGAHALQGLFDSLLDLHLSVGQGAAAIQSCTAAWEALNRHW